MTDNKQEAREKFSKLVKTNIDALFDTPLTEGEMATESVREVGNIMEELTGMNERSTEVMQEGIETMEIIRKAEAEIEDLKKIVEIKEGLEKAA